MDRSAAQQAGSARPPGRIVESDAGIAALLEGVHRVAVLGIKPSWTGQPAYYVPEYAQRAGLVVIPVPVYYPEMTSVLGQPIYRRLADIPGPIDLVNVFRRSEDVPPHVDDMLAASPRAVWMQSGIRHAGAAARLLAAGIDVVQDRCLLEELQRLGR
jgi:predicted CoA-binding protein